MNTHPLLAGLTVLLGCSGPSGPTAPGSPITATSPITAVVNGKSWSLTTLRGDTIGDLATTPLTFEVGGLDSTASERATLRVIIGNLVGTGTYTIGGFSSPAQGTYAVLSPPGDPYIETIPYQTDQTHVGSIHIESLDTVAHFVAGTFEFQAAFGNQTVTITGGRFRGHFIKL